MVENQVRMRYGAVNRFIQAVTGVFLVFFLGVHLYVAHIDFGHPVAFFTSVIEQLHNPWWMAFMIIFVWIITYHGLNGLTHIIEDTSLKSSTKRVLGILLMVLYVATSIYGTALAIVVSRIPV